MELKSHGLSNVDICNALDITEGTFYRWLREDDTKLKRALKQGLKKSEAEYKDQLLQKIEAAAEKPSAGRCRRGAAGVPRTMLPVRQHAARFRLPPSHLGDIFPWIGSVFQGEDFSHGDHVHPYRAANRLSWR